MLENIIVIVVVLFEILKEISLMRYLVNTRCPPKIDCVKVEYSGEPNKHWANVFKLACLQIVKDHCYMHYAGFDLAPICLLKLYLDNDPHHEWLLASWTLYISYIVWPSYYKQTSCMWVLLKENVLNQIIPFPFGFYPTLFFSFYYYCFTPIFLTKIILILWVKQRSTESNLQFHFIDRPRGIWSGL